MSRGGSWMRRVNESLREVIADEVTRLKDPGLGFITITGVDTSPDLRAARVFYSVLGDAEQQAATAAALVRARPRIRGEVGSRVRLKYLPDLHFELDESIDRGNRMEQLLRSLDEEDDAGPDGLPAEGG
jgi:ribosome-binding factor A